MQVGTDVVPETKKKTTINFKSNAAFAVKFADLDCNRFFHSFLPILYSKNDRS